MAKSSSRESGVPPFEYWFTSTTLTLWIAVLASIASLWVAINGDWQTAVKEQSRIAAEQASQRQREQTLAVVLEVGAEADQIAYAHVSDETQLNAWRDKSDKFWIVARDRLGAVLTTAEFANVFAPNPSAFVFGSAINELHSQHMQRLTDLAARLRNVALKYA